MVNIIALLTLPFIPFIYNFYVSWDIVVILSQVTNPYVYYVFSVFIIVRFHCGYISLLTIRYI
jgi:hypothetical protein